MEKRNFELFEVIERMSPSLIKQTDTQLSWAGNCDL